MLPSPTNTWLVLKGPGTLDAKSTGDLQFQHGWIGRHICPAQQLQLVLCYGHVNATATALELLADCGAAWAVLSSGGQAFRSRLCLGEPANMPLFAQQIQAYLSQPLSRAAACQLVREKIASQKDAVRHYQRHGRPLGPWLPRLAGFESACRPTSSLDGLRGTEGAASSEWFAAFALLFQSPWQFPGRFRRPPPDPINALLSLGYTLLERRTSALLQAVGLDSRLGHLHALRRARPSLACDLMEPLRVPAVDRWVVQLCKQKKVQPNDFQTNSPLPSDPADEGAPAGVRLTKAAFDRVVADWRHHWGAQQFDTQLRDQVWRYIEWLGKVVSLPEGVRGVPTPGVQANA